MPSEIAYAQTAAEAVELARSRLGPDAASWTYVPCRGCEDFNDIS